MNVSLLATLALATAMPSAPVTISMQSDDGLRIVAEEYGAGETSVVLAHGGRFDKSSWHAQARHMADRGFRVVAFDFRGRGDSDSPPQNAGPYDNLHLDVLAAVRYLRQTGAKKVHVVGGSIGGWAAAEAAIAEPDAIDRLVLLAPSIFSQPEQLRGEKLIIFARNDPDAAGNPRLDAFQLVYDRLPEPKSLIVVDGDAHAQHIFETSSGDELLEEIIEFLLMEKKNK